MKNKSIYTLTAFLALTFIFNACSKEERGPSVLVHVQEQNGTAAPGATVRVWPGQNAGQPGSIINEDDVDQTGITDAAGDVLFDFENSIVTDVDVIYYKTSNVVTALGLDSSWTDTLAGHKVVKLEAIRQKSESNQTTEIVEVK